MHKWGKPCSNNPSPLLTNRIRCLGNYAGGDQADEHTKQFLFFVG